MKIEVRRVLRARWSKCIAQTSAVQENFCTPRSDCKVLLSSSKLKELFSQRNFLICAISDTEKDRSSPTKLKSDGPLYFYCTPIKVHPAAIRAHVKDRVNGLFMYLNL